MVAFTIVYEMLGLSGRTVLETLRPTVPGSDSDYDCGDDLTIAGGGNGVEGNGVEGNGVEGNRVEGNRVEGRVHLRIESSPSAVTRTLPRRALQV